MKRIDLSIILPCFNEAEHFVKSVELIIGVLQKSKLFYEIIFVEDCSTDGTEKLVQAFVKKSHSPSISALYHKTNQGRGATVADGIQKAHGVYVGYIDIDCEVSPTYIPACIKKLQHGSDVVYGERIYTVTLSGLLRAASSKLYSSLVQLFFHSSVIDTESGYKFFKREKILPVLQKIRSTHWFWDTEVMILSERAGLGIVNVPVRFNRRSDKTSTVALFSDTLTYIYQLLEFRIRLFFTQ